MDRVKMATVWLGGCSGCHMSFLDMDEWLVDLAQRIDLVYSPLVDVKEYPEDVDVCLVEGAVANDENLHLVKRIRARTRLVISFGDCAVTGNVTAMRNPLGVALEVLKTSYLDKSNLHPALPSEPEILPVLLDQVRPVHAVIPVDYYLQGCPPPADRIRAVLEPLVNGVWPELPLAERRFG